MSSKGDKKLKLIKYCSTTSSTPIPPEEWKWMKCCNLPIPPEDLQDDPAIFNRIKILPFHSKFVKNNKDPKIDNYSAK